MGGQSGGNRQDNRQRGNAAQLLEKYKSMARDSQLAGDRVQTEYYLQFADHYYRVLGESRARFEDQRPRRDGNDFDDDMDDDMGEGGDEQSLRDEDERDERPQQREQRDDRGPREDRGPRDGRTERPNRVERGERPRRPDRDDDESRGNRANGGDRLPVPADRLPMDVLPPAIGLDEPPAEAAAPADDAPRPRRRTARRPAAEDSDGDIAPAA